MNSVVWLEPLGSLPLCLFSPESANRRSAPPDLVHVACCCSAWWKARKEQPLVRLPSALPACKTVLDAANQDEVVMDCWLETNTSSHANSILTVGLQTPQDNAERGQPGVGPRGGEGLPAGRALPVII